MTTLIDELHDAMGRAASTKAVLRYLREHHGIEPVEDGKKRRRAASRDCSSSHASHVQTLSVPVTQSAASKLHDAAEIAGACFKATA